MSALAEKLIVAFDIGTHCSSVAYAHVRPGQPVEVRSVKKWPDQPANESAVRSVVAYSDGEPVAFGATADREAPADSIVVDWFKLHVHPESLRDAVKPALRDLPALPVGVLKIYRDFATYLFKHFMHVHGLDR